MSFLKIGCRKFNALLSELEDREASEQEELWLELHSSNCESCRDAQVSMKRSLNMLRAAALEPEPERSFDRRVIRRVKVQSVKDSFNYWMPALVGCLLAFVAIFSTLDLLATRSSENSVKIPAGEALRGNAYPRFELNAPLHLNR